MNAQTILKKAKGLVAKSGLTYEDVGVKMGCPPESARQSVWQFLNSTNPSIEMFLRFCKAMGVEPKELLE